MDETLVKLRYDIQKQDKLRYDIQKQETFLAKFYLRLYKDEHNSTDQIEETWSSSEEKNLCISELSLKLSENYSV